MGIFNGKSKQQLININGYIIDETGLLIDVPKELDTYIIPREVKWLSPDLNLMTNKPLSCMREASEIIFEDGGVEKIPNQYFTLIKFSNLRRLTLPNNIKHLGDRCFDPTTTECNFPGSLEYLGTNMYPEVQELVIVGENIKTLGNGFASHDTNLTYVEVTGSIKELPTMFVNQCKNLKTLILHDGIEKAGNIAFRGLNCLEYVELPESFKVPFYIGEMESRGGSNKRGNSCYDSLGYTADMDGFLTINKTYNGIPYIFQIRRGDFKGISFQDMTAFIESTAGYISVDLSKLKSNTIYQVNTKEASVQEVAMQSVQNEMPIQQNPIRSRNMEPQQVSPMNDISSNSIYTDEELREQFSQLYKSYILKTDLFQKLKGSREILAAKVALYNEFCRIVKSNKKLNVNDVVMYAIYKGIVENIEAYIKDDSFGGLENANPEASSGGLHF